MGSTPPTLPRFPSFSDLGSILPPVEDEHDVWGSLVSATPPPPPSQPPYVESPAPLPPPVSSQSPPLSPYSPHLLADLDPFAPTPHLPASPPPMKPPPKHTPPRLNLGITLGSTTKPASKLELIPDSDASDSPSPTSSFVVIPPPPTPTKSSPPARPRTPPPVPPAPPRQTSVKPKPSVSLVPGGRSSPTASGSGGGTGPGGGTFFGDMFRSFSDSPTKRPVPSEKASIQASYDEKERRAAPPPPPSQPSISPSSSTSNLNPISSIANAFRSATTSRPSSRGNTPPPGSSSAAAAAAGEKGASLEVGSRVREKGSKLKGKEGEVEVTFDFARFLEQMRHRSAEPVAKYLRSFLKEFSRKPPVTTTDQIRVINDFLDFIAGKMRTVDPWKSMVMDLDAERGEAEFDMATEAMEKLVMNRLWHLTFSPAVDLNSLPGHNPPTDDLERDNVLSQRIRLFAWVTPANLDLNIKPLPPTAPSSPNPNSSSLPSSPLLGSGGSDGGTDSDGGGDKEKSARERAEREAKQTQNFLLFAKRELHKMNQYKSPRDKLICILNACKVIFGLIRHVSSEEGADAFVPFLIYVVLKANPDHLVSNIQYIQRFRNPEKLSGEGGYYLSSLNGAISFIETMDSSSLSNITQEEFEHHVEIAIQNLPIDPSDSSLRLARTPTDSTTSFAAAQQRAPEPPLSTPADISRVVNVNVDGDGEGEGDEASPKLIQQPGGVPPPGGGGGTRGFFARGTDSVERIVSKPLGAIGRIFDQLEALAGDGDGGAAVGTTQPGSSGTGTRAAGGGGGAQGGSRPGQPRRAHSSYSSGGGNALMGDGGAAAAAKDDPHAGLYVSDRMSAGQVTEEIDRQHEQKRLATLETLKGIFPQLEDEVLEMVLLSNGGDMARTIDALLEMSSRSSWGGSAIVSSRSTTKTTIPTLSTQTRRTWGSGRRGRSSRPWLRRGSPAPLRRTPTRNGRIKRRGSSRRRESAGSYGSSMTRGILFMLGSNSASLASERSCRCSERTTSCSSGFGTTRTFPSLCLGSTEALDSRPLGGAQPSTNSPTYGSGITKAAGLLVRSEVYFQRQGYSTARPTKFIPFGRQREAAKTESLLTAIDDVTAHYDEDGRSDLFPLPTSTSTLLRKRNQVPDLDDDDEFSIDHWTLKDGVLGAGR